MIAHLRLKLMDRAARSSGKIARFSPFSAVMWRDFSAVTHNREKARQPPEKGPQIKPRNPT
jgi:hypothetical protein